ncbi:MAG TPA: CoA-binding protein [Gemmatimonadales bacterium]|nr:CoA-binding protein [Gemmatimonadales bacterium]
MTEAELARLVREAKTIAVVGLSPKTVRPSNEVAAYMQDAGYRIIPVNPGHEQILGGRSYRTLAEAARDHAIDIVDVFRRSALAGGVVDEAIAIRPKLIWLQVGVVDERAKARADAAGIPMVMDRCLAVYHQQLEAR